MAATPPPDEMDDGDDDGPPLVLPPQVQALHDAFGRLVAVTEVTTGLKRLADYPPDSYSLPGEFGDLPHALLRRTDGGLEGELWANTEFSLTRDEAGWTTLEFLAWWARDLSRSGRSIQLRPMALPPRAFEVQLGRTLKFIVDHLIGCPDGNLAPMLAEMADRARSLDDAIDTHADELGPLARPAAG